MHPCFLAVLRPGASLLEWDKSEGWMPSLCSLLPTCGSVSHVLLWHCQSVSYRLGYSLSLLILSKKPAHGALKLCRQLWAEGEGWALSGDNSQKHFSSQRQQLLTASIFHFRDFYWLGKNHTHFIHSSEISRYQSKHTHTPLRCVISPGDGNDWFLLVQLLGYSHLNPANFLWREPTPVHLIVFPNQRVERNLSSLQSRGDESPDSSSNCVSSFLKMVSEEGSQGLAIDSTSSPSPLPRGHGGENESFNPLVTGSVLLAVSIVR